MKYLYLSYTLGYEIPAYGGKALINMQAVKSISKGDSANVYSITLENHWGTHVDCPAHFFENGKKVNNYNADFWHFNKPQVLEIVAKPGQIIGKEDLLYKIKPETDLLLLKSGWGKLRDKDIYSLENQGIEPLVGIWLRKEYPLIRAIGFDWVSLSSYTNRELGREAHKVFLDPEKEGRPILIIEDMLLSDGIENLKNVWVAPFRVESMDSAPCTVIGIIEEDREE